MNNEEINNDKILATKTINEYPKSIWIKTSNVDKDGYLTLKIEIDGVDSKTEHIFIDGLKKEEGIHLYSRNLSYVFIGRDKYIERLDEENHKLAYALSQSVPVESSLEQYDRIKELEEIINSDELLRQHMNSIGYRELCKLKEELQATKEQLDIAEAVLSVQVTKSAFKYFEDKQKDEVK